MKFQALVPCFPDTAGRNGAEACENVKAAQHRAFCLRPVKGFQGLWLYVIRFSNWIDYKNLAVAFLYAELYIFAYEGNGYGE